MAGPDDIGEEDALAVLTAVLLTPARFPAVLGDDFPAACAALGLPPRSVGYGLVLGQDSAGARWTVAVDDVSLVAVAVAAWDCGLEHGLSPGPDTVVTALPGWPLPLALAAPGRPAPHDPAGTGGAPLLRAPDARGWSPARRRLGADEIALRWAEWRGRIQEAPLRPDPGTAARRPPLSHPGLRRALEEADGYTRSMPPAGRVRSAFAPGGARMLRADGPGWSLVARTDDMALVLLDEEPGEVLPVPRGPRLPALLAALDAMATHPD
ncbi:hypothetical protein ABT354_13160 [Streptomyces sp. NPDC000594]|uniref:hypothetical protein n=1 Tax=Streptomyces sp. NPDC000594 TaxID=3154261 RepID=UPI00331D1446